MNWKQYALALRQVLVSITQAKAAPFPNRVGLESAYLQRGELARLALEQVMPEDEPDYKAICREVAAVCSRPHNSAEDALVDIESALVQVPKPPAYKSADEWLNEDLGQPGCVVGDAIAQMQPVEAARQGFAAGLYAQPLETAPDAFVEANRQLLLDRSRVGLQKYGTTLEREDLSTSDWLQHLIEELLDAANYAQRLKALLGPLKLSELQVDARLGQDFRQLREAAAKGLRVNFLTGDISLTETGKRG